MKVILLEDVKTVGKKGDVVEVYKAITELRMMAERK